jgi:hypothetical protein
MPYENLRTKLNAIKTNIDSKAHLTNAEKHYLKLSIVILESRVQVASENGAFDVDSRGLNTTFRGLCGWKCWLVAAGLGAALWTAPSCDNNASTNFNISDCESDLFWVGAVLGFVAGVAMCPNCNEFNNPTCFTPEFVPVSDFDCNGGATLSVINAGTAAQTFNWNNENGDPATATTSATSEGSTSLRVRQTGTSSFVGRVTPSCNSTLRAERRLDIRTLAGSPGTAFIASNDGAQTIQNVSTGSEHIYILGGTLTGNANNSMDVLLTGSVGSVIQQGNNFVKVRWSRQGTGTIRTIIRNSCSNQDALSSEITVNIN